ncbi:MAG: APC family permease [Brevinema sp.]
MNEKPIPKFSLIAIALGTIIGWGAFILPGEYYLKDIGGLNFIIGFGIGTLVLVAIIINFWYLAIHFSSTGGSYGHAVQLLPRKISFFLGWFLAFSYILLIPLNATAISIVSRFVVPHLYITPIYNAFGQDVYLWDLILSIGTTILFFFLNTVGVKSATMVQDMIVMMFLMFVFYCVVRSINNPAVSTSTILTHFQTSDIASNKIFQAAALAPWAFLGFETIFQFAGKSAVPSEKIGVLSLATIIVGYFIYVLLTVFTGLALTKTDIQTQNIAWGLGFSIEKVFGIGSMYFLVISVLCAILSSINGVFLTIAELFESIWSNTAHKSRKFPSIFACTLASIVGIVIPFLGRSAVTKIVDLSSFGIALCYFVTSYFVFQKAKPTVIKITGFAGMIISIFFLVLVLLPKGGEGFVMNLPYITIAVWVILGIFVYRWMRRATY